MDPPIITVVLKLENGSTSRKQDHFPSIEEFARIDRGTPTICPKATRTVTITTTDHTEN